MSEPVATENDAPVGATDNGAPVVETVVAPVVETVVAPVVAPDTGIDVLKEEIKTSLVIFNDLTDAAQKKINATFDDQLTKSTDKDELEKLLADLKATIQTLIDAQEATTKAGGSRRRRNTKKGKRKTKRRKGSKKRKSKRRKI